MSKLTYLRYDKTDVRSWNTANHMPPAVLKKLHSTWPDLELSVTVADRQLRNLATQDRQMDLALLSSPLLVHLTYAVYKKRWGSEPCVSEWPRLTRALLSGGNIRTLRVRCSEDGTAYHGVEILDESELPRLPRLDLVPGARLPKLEELKIEVKGSWGDPRYPWDEEHCRALRNAIDPFRLRVLDFGSDNPEHFFTAFLGHVPNVRSLRFGVREGDMGPAAAFIDSLTCLESLSIGSAEKGINELWPSIRGHKETLKSLVLGPRWGPYCGPIFISRDRLKETAKNFPKIEHIGWHLPCGTSVSAFPSSIHVLVSERYFLSIASWVVQIIGLTMIATSATSKTKQSVVS